MKMRYVFDPDQKFVLPELTRYATTHLGDLVSLPLESIVCTSQEDTHSLPVQIYLYRVKFLSLVSLSLLHSGQGIYCVRFALRYTQAVTPRFPNNMAWSGAPLRTKIIIV